MKKIEPSEYTTVLQGVRRADKGPYYLFYSSLWDGYVTDPALMQVPFDDHLTHRGDGVFETLKCVAGAVYNPEAHLRRLQRSAYQVGLLFPQGRDGIRARMLEALTAAAQPDCSVRLVLSRGPGGMGVSPKECTTAALYICVYGAGHPFMESHPSGATLGRSRIAAKDPLFATAKTCNYLPNVLMKAEAEALGVDFMLGIDRSGHITEGATENVGIVSKSGRLVFPALDTVLAGTTMLRVSEMAQQLTADGRLKGCGFRPIREEELYDAREILIVGTTLNVVSVTEYNGRHIGDGTPGPVGQALDAMLLRDTLENPRLRVRYM